MIVARLSSEQWDEVKAVYCVGKRTLEDIGWVGGVGMNRRMVIRDEASRQAAIRFIAGASIAGALDVAISAHKPSRSRDQNALYWQWMTVLAAETGHSKDEMHGMLKKRLMLPLMLEYPERYTKAVDANELLGAMPHKWRAIAELISTTDLTALHFGQYLNEIEAFAGGMGIRLPHPDDLYMEAIYGARSR